MNAETPAAPGSVVPAGLAAVPEWSDAALAGAGVAVSDVAFVSVGGGLGSFAAVDLLRVAGAAREDIAVISPTDRPHDRFRHMARSSQMVGDEPLRSDSASRPDNAWGFPGFALSEARRRRTPRPLARVLVEPLLAEYYNPRVDDVYAGLEREAARIGWKAMVSPGTAVVVRRRTGGGYFVLSSPAGGGGPPLLAHRCRWAHLAVGYPALRLLPDFQRFRSEHDDSFRMVHVYEDHSHVYDTLARSPGTVLLRGGGIAASRVLQRLADDRDHLGARTEIHHLVRGHRAPAGGGRRGGPPTDEGVVHQPFNFPKAAFGGQVARRVAAMSGAERAEFLRVIGRPSTARRRVWQEQIERGRREGWYRRLTGRVIDVAALPDGRVRATVQGPARPLRRLDVDFVVDATGLVGDVASHGLVDDLLRRGGARLNPAGGLDVDERFEVRGTRSGAGRLYASGTIAHGGPVAPVDSFFGLEQAALAIGDDLAAQGLFPRLGPWRSVAAWWGWMRDRPL